MRFPEEKAILTRRAFEVFRHNSTDTPPLQLRLERVKFSVFSRVFKKYTAIIRGIVAEYLRVS
jgi:hypothetical protein